MVGNMGGFRGAGGGGVADVLLLGFRPPVLTHRVPLCTILRYAFLMTDPKVFLKAPWAPIYINFEGGARAEKTRLFGKNLPKSA